MLSSTEKRSLSYARGSGHRFIFSAGRFPGERFLLSGIALILIRIDTPVDALLTRKPIQDQTVESEASFSQIRIQIMDTPFAIATNVEKETGNNYRIDIEIIVPVTLEKFRLDLNELVDHPHQIGGFPPSGEWGNVVVTTRGLPRLKPGDKIPVVVQE